MFAHALGLAFSIPSLRRDEGSTERQIVLVVASRCSACCGPATFELTDLVSRLSSTRSNGLDSSRSRGESRCDRAVSGAVLAACGLTQCVRFVSISVDVLRAGVVGLRP